MVGEAMMVPLLWLDDSMERSGRVEMFLL